MGSTFDFADFVVVLDDVLTDQELAQAAILVHFFHDVAPTDELAFDVDLREGWPVGVDLDLFSELVVREYVDIFEVLDVVGIEQDDHELTESTLGHLAGSFHEDANVVLGDPLGDLVVQLVVG